MKKRLEERNRKIIKTLTKILLVGVIAGIIFFSASALLFSSGKIFDYKNLGIEKAYAVETGVGIPGHGTTFDTAMAYIKAVFDFSLKLGVALTALMLIFAGYKYMTSQGNPSALNEAKDIMIGSLSGFIMLLLVYLILNVYNLSAP